MRAGDLHSGEAQEDVVRYPATAGIAELRPEECADYGAESRPGVLDDRDELVEAVALAAGEGDELSCLLDDGASSGRAGDGDATSASEFEQSFVAE